MLKVYFCFVSGRKFIAIVFILVAAPNLVRSIVLQDPLGVGTVLQNKISDLLINITPSNEAVPVIVHLNSQPSDAQISILQTLGTVKYRYKIINAVALSIPSVKLDSLAALDFVNKVEPDAV